MKILIAYWSFPEYDKNSGGYRMYEIVKYLQSKGNVITFIAGSSNERKYRLALEQLGVECIAKNEQFGTKTNNEKKRWLQDARFDIAILCEHFLYAYYAPYLRAFSPGTKLVFDTVDLHYLRIERERQLGIQYQGVQDPGNVYDEEVSCLYDADEIWSITDHEKNIISNRFDIDDSTITTVKNIHSVDLRGYPFEQRAGIVFIGSYHHYPNVDAVNYFFSDIYPLLLKKYPDIAVTIAGSDPPEEIKAYSRTYPHVIVTGYIEDHRSILLNHKIGIAPLRYGAGMKGKICEYMSCGLPTVTTGVGAEGMDLVHRENVIIADTAEEFVRSISELFSHQSLWKIISENGKKYISENLSPKVVGEIALDSMKDVITRHHPHRSKYIIDKHRLFRTVLKNIIQLRKSILKGFSMNLKWSFHDAKLKSIRTKRSRKVLEIPVANTR